MLLFLPLITNEQVTNSMDKKRYHRSTHISAYAILEASWHSPATLKCHPIVTHASAQAGHQPASQAAEGADREDLRHASQHDHRHPHVQTSTPQGCNYTTSKSPPTTKVKRVFYFFIWSSLATSTPAVDASKFRSPITTAHVKVGKT